MTIFAAIKRAQLLLNNASTSNNNAEITGLLQSLSTELENINTFAHQLNTEQASTSQVTPETKSGCYVFADEKGFFCPVCYDRDKRKIPTTRINSKLRVCSVCRINIK